MLAGTAAASDAGYQIKKSLRFNHDDSDHIHFTPGADGDQRQNTLSYWFKNTGDRTVNVLTSQGTDGNNRSHQGIENDKFYKYEKIGNDKLNFTTNKIFYDPGAWVHVVEVIDTPAALDTDRYKLWFNGRRLSDSDISWTTKYGANLQTLRSKAIKHVIGGRYSMSNDDANMLIADVQYRDGQVLSPACFGEFDEFDVWQPKAFKLPTPNTDAGSPTWSNMWESDSDAGSTGNAENPTYLFNGDETSHSNNAQSNTHVRWVPTTPIKYQTLEVKYGSIQSGVNQVFINGEKMEEYNTPGGSIYTDANGTLTELKVRDVGSTHGRLWYVKIDGVMLKDGKVDTTTWSNVNNSITWSSSLSASGGFNGSYPATNAFTGAIDSATRVQAASNDTAIVLSGITIPVKSSIEIYSGKSTFKYQINNSGSYTTVTGHADIWFPISFSGNLTDLKIMHGTAGEAAGYSGIKIDGTPLYDGTKDGSYHLKFEDTSNLGKDSLNSNNWTVVNLLAESGEVKKSAAASKPILGTSDDFGETYSSGYETDSNSSNLVLAISGKTLADNHADVKGSGTNHSISNSSSTTSTDRSKFYGTAVKTDGGTQHFVVADSSDWEFGSGEFTIEFWINAEDIDSDGLAAWLMKGTNDSNNSFDWRFYASGDGSNENIYCDFMTSDGAKYMGVNTNNAPNDEWVHISAVRDNTDNKFYLYKNGVKIDEEAVASGATIDDDYNDGLTWGYFNAISGGNHYGFNGWVNDIRIYKGYCKYPGGTTFKVITRGTPEDLDLLNDSPSNYEEDDGTLHGNFCTLNPLEIRDNSGSQTHKEGNLYVEGTSSAGAWHKGRATLSIPKGDSGKWYYEAECIENVSDIDLNVGWDNPNYEEIHAGGMGDNAGTWCYKDDGNKRHGGTTAGYGNSWTNGDTIGVGYDNGSLYFWKNGTIQNSGTAAYTSVDKPLIPTYSIYTQSNAVGKLRFNFGQRPFRNLPTGYQGICTQRFPDLFSGDQLNKPNSYFDAITWTGNGTARTIKLPFQPELVWVKPRTANAGGHELYDALRGATKIMYSHGDDVEETKSQGVTAFTSDGFTLGDGTGVGGNTDLNLISGWAWDCGAAAATPSTDGSITLTGQWVNATAGFSISTWNGTAADATVGHGLGAKPDWYIVKKRNEGGGWINYHKDIGATKGLNWSTTNASIDTDGYFNDTEPTNTVFSVSVNGETNGSSGKNYLAYAFSSIPQYSAFGEYTGITSNPSHGIFIHTGFQPRWIMIKVHSESNSQFGWRIIDTARDKFNDAGIAKKLTADDSDGENTSPISTSEGDISILSNGFWIRDAHSVFNTESREYIWMAFAQYPMKTARAR